MIVPTNSRFALGRALAAGLAASVLTVPAARATAPGADDGQPLGATVDGLLAAARRLSPDLAAGALDAAAAAARVEAAGDLDDPTLRGTSGEDRDEHGRRLNKMHYGVEQEFPLWGKRELRRRVAEAEADGARGTTAPPGRSALSATSTTSCTRSGRRPRRGTRRGWAAKPTRSAPRSSAAGWRWSRPTSNATGARPRRG